MRGRAPDVAQVADHLSDPSRCAGPRVMRPVGGRWDRRVGMGVDGLSPGDYELLLSVRDEVSGERREPFTLVTPR
jgi:hypothetical protein